MSYKIYVMDPETHEKDIIEVWENNLSSEVQSHRFNWFYKFNPDGKPYTWLAESQKENKIVGSASIYPRNININGKIEKSAVAADFAIDKKHRVFGPAIPLQKIIGENYKNYNFIFVLAYPNHSSKAVFQRIGYKTLGMASDWSKLLRSEKKLEKFLKIKFLTRIICLFLDSFLNLIDWIERFNYRDEDFIVRIIESCDDKFDILWNSGKNNFRITPERSSQYLKWRYANNKNEKYKFLVLYNKNETEILAYLTYSVINDIAFINDIFFKNLDHKINYLILQFSSFMRKLGIEIIYLTYLGDKRFSDRLKQLRFIEREQTRACYLLLSEDNEELLNPDNWFLLDGDMDI